MEKQILDSEEIKKASIDELYELLSCSVKGLTGAEAKERLEKYGYNEIVEKKVSPLMKFLGYFWGPIPWMIEIAAILSSYTFGDLALFFQLLVIGCFYVRSS